MYNSCKQVSEFSLEGEILSQILEDGDKLKYLRISGDRGIEYLVKLCKELRTSLSLVLTPGLRVKVAGEKQHNLKNGKIKLKAYSLKLSDSENPAQPQVHTKNTPVATLTCDRKMHSPTTSQTALHPAKTKTKILVCQKSDCQKRGGAAVCKALENALNSRGLAQQVTVQGTGCLKQCKAGPNIVVMPDKTRYSRIKPAEIPAILDKHFTT
ncbi:MAG: (2Fe-2S) ferredoxin domain-containing protein [Tychonema bourrellyi B0820]|uniref:(Fe-S)-binding protein n=1 Tax=Tychonema bourrellyi FEM_GT703 TaxID=2040638 RepID=A0A2G4EXI3_9CYAN|nr:(2Fe-2S) ferredoxin domain-containing protein [Tychonema bourrellyi]MDQ2100445.1 (2Fe-2S) ferredoxin domain-containing protein [Tychonema bourrellyi B0820]PHX54231.1 (Fe-S)-binding protein [Tychonema bourrellyi FEM_GT703]